MSFHTPLDLRTMASQLLAAGVEPKRSDERSYIVQGPVRYEVGELGSGEIIAIPPGFVTDLASVPRIFWPIIGPSGRHAAAAVVHDFLYCTQDNGKFTRREADYIFREAMLVSNTPVLRVWVMWAAVRLGGFIAWHRNKGLKRNAEWMARYSVVRGTNNR